MWNGRKRKERRSRRGEVLFVLETEKVTYDVEAPEWNLGKNRRASAGDGTRRGDRGLAPETWGGYIGTASDSSRGRKGRHCRRAICRPSGGNCHRCKWR